MNLLKNKPLYVTINQISVQNKDKCSAEKWESGGSYFLSCKKQEASTWNNKKCCFIGERVLYEKNTEMDKTI